jgi:hypothetical protein
MTKEKAFETLNLKSDATSNEIVAAYREAFNDLNVFISNAPTEHQRNLYSNQLVELNKAFSLLGGTLQEDKSELPNSAPVHDDSSAEKHVIIDESQKSSENHLSEQDALKLLDLKIPFSTEILEKTYSKKKRDLETGMKSALNNSLKHAYKEEIDKLAEAHTLLLPKAKIKEKKKMPAGVFTSIGIGLVLMVILFVWQPWSNSNAHGIDTDTREEFIKLKSQADILAEKQDWAHALEKYKAAYALIADAEVQDSIASMEQHLSTIELIAQKEAEAKDWAAAKKANTSAAYLDFIKKYPSGKQSAFAQRKLKSLKNEAGYKPKQVIINDGYSRSTEKLTVGRLYNLQTFLGNSFNYYGEISNNQPNGRGKSNFESGSLYEGYYRNGNRHGRGTMSMDNGDTYIGDFKDDRYHGRGTYKYANGNVYEGEFKFGDKNGFGIFTYSNRIYKGEFKDDYHHGHGEMTWNDGSMKYSGEFKNGKAEGRGTMIYQRGDEVTGEFKNGKVNGYAKYIFYNGNVYEGEFKDNKYHGKGSFYWSSGAKYVGDWIEGQQAGYGIYYNSKGELEYEGKYIQGKRVQ